MHISAASQIPLIPDALHLTAPALPQVPDVLVATEVLYEPAYYKDLLDAVDALTGPTTPVYFCYKNRNLNEGSFAEHAQQRGFALEVISDEQFQEEYRDGSYKAFWMKRAG